MRNRNPFENIKFNERLVAQILDRCENATSKVTQRVKEFYVPKIEGTPPSLMQYMDYLEGELITLIRDPKNPVGGGEFDDWKQEEVTELYTVLFGKDVPGFWYK